MKYHIYIEDSIVPDIEKLEGPLSAGVIHAGFVEEKTIEAENIEEAVKMAREWAEDFSSDVVDHVTVIVEEIETGQHRRLEVFICYQPDENEPGMKEGVALDAGSGYHCYVHYAPRKGKYVALVRHVSAGRNGIALGSIDGRDLDTIAREIAQTPKEIFWEDIDEQLYSAYEAEWDLSLGPHEYR